MKWVALIILVLIGLVEFALRVAMTVLLCAIVVGLILFLEGDGLEVLDPICWKIARDVLRDSA